MSFVGCWSWVISVRFITRRDGMKCRIIERDEIRGMVQFGIVDIEDCHD